jgi:hypothetical protein
MHFARSKIFPVDLLNLAKYVPLITARWRIFKYEYKSKTKDWGMIQKRYKDQNEVVFVIYYWCMKNGKYERNTHAKYLFSSSIIGNIVRILYVRKFSNSSKTRQWHIMNAWSRFYLWDTPCCNKQQNLKLKYDFANFIKMKNCLSQPIKLKVTCYECRLLGCDSEYLL